MKNFILLSLFIGIAFWYGKNEDRVNDIVMYHTLSTVDSVSQYLAENDNEVNINHEDSIIASPDNMYKVEYIINNNGYKHPVKVTTNGKPKLVHEDGVYTITYSFITGGNYSFSGDKNTTIKIVSVTKVGEETKAVAHNKKEITSNKIENKKHDTIKLDLCYNNQVASYSIIPENNKKVINHVSFNEVHKEVSKKKVKKNKITSNKKKKSVKKNNVKKNKKSISKKIKSSKKKIHKAKKRNRHNKVKQHTSTSNNIVSPDTLQCDSVKCDSVDAVILFIF